MAKPNGKDYVIAVCRRQDDPYICGALHVERPTSSWTCETDEEAAHAAQRDGVKLLYGIPYVQDGIYLDTPENRWRLDSYSRAMRRLVLRKQTAHRKNKRLTWL